MASLSHIQHEGLGARDGRYPVTGITVFDGPLGSGKTTALRAVELALTGKSRDISTISQLKETLGRATSTSQLVRIEISDTEIQREWAKSQKIAMDPPAPGIPPDLKLQQFYITNTFGDPPVTADLQELEGLSREKFNSWILQKLGTEDVDISECLRNGIDDETDPDAVIQAMEKLIEGNRQGKLSASEWIQVLEESAREQKNAVVALFHDAEAGRRDSARLVTAVPALAQAIADLQTQIETAKSEHETTVRTLGEQEERAERIQAIQAKIATCDEQLQTLQNIPDDWNAEQKAADAKRILDAIKIAADASSNVQRGNQAEIESRARIEGHNIHVTQFLAQSLERGEMLLKNAQSCLDESDILIQDIENRELLECPECGHKFPDKSVVIAAANAQAKRAELETRHQETLAAVEQDRQVPGDHFLNDKELLRLQECRKQLAAEEQTLANIQDKLPKARQKEEEAVEAVRKLLVEFFGPDYDENQDVIEQATEQAKSWLSMLTAIQSRDRTKAKRLELEQEIAGLSTVNLQDLRDLEAAQKQAVRDLDTSIRSKQGELAGVQKQVSDEARIEALQAQVEVWKRIVDIVQSARQSVVDGALSGLIYDCNHILAATDIGSLEIRDGAFTLYNQDGARPWAALSSGEKALVGITIAAAFAGKRDPNKLQAISIDNAECVGQERLPDLLRMASCIWDSIRVQCLIAGHFDGTQLQELDHPDLTVHDLRILAVA